MENLITTYAGGYLGDTPPQKKKGNIEMENLLLPPDVAQANKQILSNEQLRELQEQADELELLLPSEFNRSVAGKPHKYSDGEIEKLLPPGMCINCD
jgi:hypothetical protein